MLASRTFYKLFTSLFIIPTFVIVMAACNDAGNNSPKSSGEADISENTNEDNEAAEASEASDPERYEDYENGIVRLEEGEYLWVQGNYYVVVE